MRQNTAGHGSRARSEDEDVVNPQARQPETQPRVRPRQPAGQPAGDGNAGPDEPDEEYELIGDNDLGAADLGPADPNFTDPDARSGRVRKII